MSDRNKEAGRKRWDGISKEDRIAHIRKMVEARVNRVIQCPNCEHEFMVNKGLIIAPEAKPEVTLRPIVKVQAPRPARAVSVAEIEEIPAGAGKKPKPTDMCLHGMEYRFCRTYLCKAMVA